MLNRANLKKKIYAANNCLANLWLRYQLQQCKLNGIVAGNQLLLHKIFLCLASFMLAGFMKLGPGKIKISMETFARSVNDQD